MERSLTALADPATDRPAAVRTLRKLGKSLRGGFQITRLPSDISRPIRAVGRLLSPHREAIARRNTWRKLEWNAHPATATAITSLLEQQAEAHHPPPAALDWCRARVAEARSALDASPEKCFLKSGPAVAKLRRRLEKRVRNLASAKNPDFHETRKQLKAYLGALGFLANPPPADPALERLGDLLGKENDLTTLASWLRDRGIDPQLEPELWHHLQQSLTTTRHQAVKAAAALFS
jgi:hypothetical protein